MPDSGERQCHFQHCTVGSFKTKAEVTLFTVTVIIFKPTLTATAKVFDQRAIGCGLTPEGVSKPAGGAEYLHRNVVAFSFGAPTSGA